MRRYLLVIHVPSDNSYIKKKGSNDGLCYYSLRDWVGEEIMRQHSKKVDRLG